VILTSRIGKRVFIITTLKVSICRCSDIPKKGAEKITPLIFKVGFLSRNVLITMQPIELPYKKVGKSSSN